MEDSYSQQQGGFEVKNKSFKKRSVVMVVFFIFLIFYFLFNLFIGSFVTFDVPVNVEIQKGESLKTISLHLEDSGVISSSSLLSSIVILIGGESHIVSGLYSFDKKEGVYFTAKRIISGKTNIKATKITFPEGFNSMQMARRLSEMLPNFDSNTFIKLAKPREGFLFPDTYFFLPNDTTEVIVDRLSETFWQKVEEKFEWIQGCSESVCEAIKNSVTLASIVEEEVQSLDDKRKVADIFLRRMKIDMPLQADSTLAYVTGRDSLSLTVEDLKSTSLYNTYTNKGLPPTPISNPGLESIEAVLNPTPNKYFYFLTDKEGKVYYARTFEEHKQNKVKYLK